MIKETINDYKFEQCKEGQERFLCVYYKGAEGYKMIDKISLRPSNEEYFIIDDRYFVFISLYAVNRKTIKVYDTKQKPNYRTERCSFETVYSDKKSEIYYIEYGKNDAFLYAPNILNISIKCIHLYSRYRDRATYYKFETGRKAFVKVSNDGAKINILNVDYLWNCIQNQTNPDTKIFLGNEYDAISRKLGLFDVGYDGKNAVVGYNGIVLFKNLCEHIITNIPKEKIATIKQEISDYERKTDTFHLFNYYGYTKDKTGTIESAIIEKDDHTEPSNNKKSKYIKPSIMNSTEEYTDLKFYLQNNTFEGQHRLVKTMDGKVSHICFGEKSIETIEQYDDAKLYRNKKGEVFYITTTDGKMKVYDKDFKIQDEECEKVIAKKNKLILVGSNTTTIINYTREKPKTTTIGTTIVGGVHQVFQSSNKKINESERRLSIVFKKTKKSLN